MTPELRARIQSIFDEALAREGPARAAFVAEACAGDDELRREVESLLAAHADAGSFLDRTPGGGATEPDSAPGALAPGTRIGHFETIGPIGAGGMGLVVAARDLDLDRKVAIKLVGAGGGEHRDERQARLLREAQALAKLSHPNVTTVFETGTFGDDVYLA